MSTSKRILNNTLYLYVRMGVSIVFSFFTTRILLQALGVSDYGLYNVIAGSLAMLGFVSASMSTATQRYISYSLGEGDIQKTKVIFKNALYLHNLISLIVICVFVFVGIILFNGLLTIPEDRFYVAVIVYCSMIFSTAFAITIVPYDAVINAYENMKYYSLLGISDVILKFIIAFSLLFIKDLDRLAVYGIIMAIESWFFRYITKIYCHKKYIVVREASQKKVSRECLKELSSYAGWNIAGFSSAMILNYGTTIVLNHYFGTIVNAAMGVATQVTGVMMGVSSNMSKAMTPLLVKTEGAHDRERMIKITLEGTKFYYLLFAFFCIPIGFCLKPLLRIWLVEVPDWTYVFCILLIISLLVEQMCYFLSQSIAAQGDIRNYNIVRSIVNLLPIPILIIEFEYGFLPYHGIFNRILFWSFLGDIILLYYSYRNFKLPMMQFVINVFVPCILSSGISAIACWFLMPMEDCTTIITVVKLGLMLISNLPIYWFFALSKYERGVLSSLIRK